MGQAGPLRWRDGSGWLVLLGGGDPLAGETELVDVAALDRADPDGPLVILPAAGLSPDLARELVAYFADLGLPHGRVLPLFDAEAGPTVEAAGVPLLTQAGLIYLADGDPHRLVAAVSRPLLRALGDAYEAGAVVLGAGAGAAALGTWLDFHRPGWGWIINTIVAPHFTGTRHATTLQALMAAHPALFGLGLPDRVALALGPHDEVETWGSGRPTILLPRAMGMTLGRKEDR